MDTFGRAQRPAPTGLYRLRLFSFSHLHRFEIRFCRFAVEANQFDVLAMRGVERMGIVIADILETYLDLFERYIFCVPQEET